MRQIPSGEFLNGVVEDMRQCGLDEALPNFKLTPSQRRRIGGEYRNLRLSSVFQPIFLANGRGAVGFEALLRASDVTGEAVGPERVFSMPQSAKELVCLDRLARIMHVVNYLLQAGDNVGKLFLNLHPRHLSLIADSHGQFFGRVLQLYGLSPERIVLEILESGVDDTRQLQNAIANYRGLGFGIAIDDFGRKHSNLDRLWLLEPDVVKLDRSLIEQAASSRKMWRVLGHVVQIVHELEAKVVCEGIEDVDQLRLAQDAGVDWVQGYFLATPSTAISNRCAYAPAEEKQEIAFAFA